MITMPVPLPYRPGPSTAAATSPISIREKYSGALNLSTISASGGANMAMMIAMVPAQKEPIAAIASAGPRVPGVPI